MAYVIEMTIRLVELHRVLRSTGSLYLHSDPTVSHYLKLVLDALFGPRSFRNEVIWKRSSAHNASKKWSPVHDVILFYTKSSTFTWRPIYQPLPAKTLAGWYNNVEPETGRRFNRADLTAPGIRSGASGAPWRGIDPTSKGRHWAIPRFASEIVGSLGTHEALDALDAAGRLHWPRKANGAPMLKRYIEEAQGVPPLDVITDIAPLNNATTERLGWPTQKPRALLQRLIEVSTDPGDLVLDAFCGCGTALDAAERLHRSWIGVDISWRAISIMQDRLRALGLDNVPVEGSPRDLDGARERSRMLPDGREQFEAWALTLVGAVPHGGPQRKGADQGADGVITFSASAGTFETAIVSVKSGRVHAADVQQLKGAMQRHGARMGFFVTLSEPTAPMVAEAATAGQYHSPLSDRDYQAMQILTIRELVQEGRRPDLPPLLIDDYRATFWSDQEVPLVPRPKRSHAGIAPRVTALRDRRPAEHPRLAGVRADLAKQHPSDAPTKPRQPIKR
jgi:site-specific DNA-methyltransferase (adenine-specific)